MHGDSLTAEAPAAASEGDDDQEEGLDDLFGDDDEVEPVAHEKDEDTQSVATSERLPSPEREHRKAMEYAEEDVVDQGGQLEADVQIPNVPAPRSSDGQQWVLRIPSYVRIDSKPFHPDTYYGPEDEDSEQASLMREKSMSIRLAVENTVRWRWTKDKNGVDRRQSNARVIRWSDGTLSLKLGRELFDINQTLDTSGAVARQGLGASQSQQGLSQSQSQSQSQIAGANGVYTGLTYLVAQHKRAEILQAEAVITGTMSLQPTDMLSETHRMLVKAVGQKHVKTARLRMAPDPTRDPELELMEEMKRDKKTRVRGPKDEGDEFGEKRRRRSGGGGRSRARRAEDVWSDEDEDDGVYGGFDDEDMGGGSSQKRSRAKEEKKRGGDYETDDFLVADSDEDADAGGDSDEEVSSRPKKKSKRREEEHSEEDPLDKLDAAIEAEEEKKRKSGKSGDEDEDSEDDHEKDVHKDEDDADKMDMDVESEEDEDEGRVRKAGTASGTRKKRVVGYDEEEDE
ncbi:hypothetical protein PUNSTDRAFT_106334 [Punctularia strigosozonata HHB-11173 SS5]|uniref:uncharacterized protein n=1 Tax=Punctularia strigosozonata (strain HHB-11173) TaxID=741275 RepID=UPI00044170C1|nr:uncharacterized protein PUNSTDRAFT_106334 [Punctularia strigosozonata HHB-11173 SS5]EIN06136.1 hypothetical protein PUNSTDRAFT_106334 [Punctularia strigosozonata HHB-11173 SS5]